VPIGLGPAHDEVPVGRVVLDDLRERRLGGRHVAVEAVPTEQVIEDVAIGGVGVVPALQAGGHAHRFVAALQRQERAVLARAHPVLDDDPHEHRLGLAPVAEPDLDLLTRHEVVGVGRLEGLF
jgi:hypothetical protein